MTDIGLTVLWVGALGCGLGVAVWLRGRGASRAHARDLLHVGTGVWVVGWPWWNGLVAPLAIVGAGAAGLALVPLAAGRLSWVDRLRHSVADGDERFAGLVLYGVSFAVMTALGLLHRPFPAGAALLALALGDGLGGLAGRRFGRRFYSVAHGKRKSLEGSAAVGLFGAVGVLLAAALFGVDVPAWRVVALGVVAAVSEGLAPRGTDNAVIPVAVWAAAELFT